MKKELKNLFGSAQFRKGSYSSILIVILVAIIVAVNFMVIKLPTGITNVDISSTNIYSIGSVTTDLLKGLDSDVEIIVIAETDSIDTRITTLLDKYADASDHIKITYKDPALYPSVLTTYDTTTDNIVIKSEETDKNKIVAFSDIIVSTTDSYGYTTESEFDGEGQLTTAINYVATDSSKTVYALTGHGETELGTSITEAIEKSNFTISSLSLLTEELPDDCDTLIINKPTADLTDDELTTIDAYLNAGGNVVVLLTVTDVDTPNLDALMAEFGVKSLNTYIGDASRAISNYNSYYVTAPIYSDGSITGAISDSDLLVAVNSVGLDVSSVDNVTTDEFLVTSEDGIKYIDDNTDPTTGTYTYAVAATKTISSDADSESETDATDSTSDSDSTTDTDAVTAHLTVYGCGSIIEDDYFAGESAVKNSEVFVNSLTVNFSDIANISIPSISLTIPTNTFADTGLIGAVIVFILPIGLIIVGLVRWLFRRRL